MNLLIFIISASIMIYPCLYTYIPL